MTKKKSTGKDARRAASARGARAAPAADDAAKRKRESGEPGGGQGRRDVVGRSGVYPESASERPSKDAPVRTERSWGQGERGAAGYEDSGGSELVMREGQLLGGLTSGPSGEPTIDIHGKGAGEKRESSRAARASRDKRKRKG